jgi:uncharacterized LabA/DUF88 family protein
MNKREINFLRLLCFEGGNSGLIALPPERNILKYLSGRGCLNQEEAKHLIEVFGNRRFLTLEKDKKGKIVSIRLCITSEDIDYMVMSREKIFAVFIDYLNIERGITNQIERRERMRDFGWLINPILEKGKIAFIYIFVPDATVPEFSPIFVGGKQRIPIVVCPRRVVGGVMKDADTVDQFLMEMATSHIYHSDISDIVIVSGDADFSPVIRRALMNRKRVTVVSTAQALSGRFREIGSEIDIVAV